MRSSGAIAVPLDLLVGERSKLSEVGLRRTGVFDVVRPHPDTLPSLAETQRGQNGAELRPVGRSPAAGGDDCALPRSIPVMVTGASSSVLALLTLQEFSPQFVGSIDVRQLAPFDHPRQGNAHRPAGDVERFADRHQQAAGKAWRVGAQQSRGNDAPRRKGLSFQPAASAFQSLGYDGHVRAGAT